MTFSGVPAGVTDDFLTSPAGKALSAQYQLNAMGQYYDDQLSKQKNGNSSNNSSGSSSSSGSSGSSSFGLSDFNSAAKSSTDLAKDMAQFQLGINDQQSAQDQKYRFAESDHTLANTKSLNEQTFGFDTAKAAQQQGYTQANSKQAFQQNYALAGQQNQANLGLDAQRNAAAMAQLTKQTDTQKEMQQADFGNQSTQRAQAAALAQLGFRR